MQTLYDFNALNDHDKGEAVWKGTFLADRQEQGLAVQLYRLDAFYVEVYYDSGSNQIVRFRSFSSANQLASYLAPPL